MIIMYVLIKVCIWVLGLCKLEAFGVLVGILEFSLHIVAKFLCSCLCLFDIVVELHAMDDFIIGMPKLIYV
jgi:hypothetical protein